jgi:hypothetical protein
MQIAAKIIQENPIYPWLMSRRLILYRVFIVTGLMLAVPYLAPRIASGDNRSTLILLLFVGLAGAVVLLKWPVLGFIFTIAGGMFIGFRGPGGVNISILGVVLLIGLWAFENLARHKPFYLAPSRTVKPILVFMIFSILSFLFGQLPWFNYATKAPLEAQLGGLAIFLFSFIIFLLTPILLKDIRSLQLLTWVFIGLGAIYVAGRAVTWGRIDSIYQYGLTAGSLFWVWLVVLSFSQALLNTTLKMHWRILLFGICGLTFYVGYFQANDWVSGWFPPLLAVATIVYVRFFLRYTVFLVPIAAIILFYLLLRLIDSDYYSWSTRLDAWLIVLNMSMANPLLGLGFGNYYWYTPLFPIRGYFVVFNSHSQFVDLIAQTGFIGLLVFFWFFWEAGKLSWQLRNIEPAGFTKAYAYGVLGGVVGTLVAASLVDWVLPFVYNIGMTGFRASILVWIFLGGLVSIEQLVNHQNKLVTGQTDLPDLVP